MTKTGLANSTINHFKKTIGAVFNYMIDSGVIYQNPVNRIRSLKVINNTFMRPLTIKETNKLLTVVKKHYPDFYPLLSVLTHTHRHHRNEQKPYTYLSHLHPQPFLQKELLYLFHLANKNLHQNTHRYNNPNNHNSNQENVCYFCTATFAMFHIIETNLIIFNSRNAYILPLFKSVPHKLSPLKSLFYLQQNSLSKSSLLVQSRHISMSFSVQTPSLTAI